MARARFLADYDYAVVGKPVTLASKTGTEETVKRDCLTKAAALGRAVEVPAPSRSEVSNGR